MSKSKLTTIVLPIIRLVDANKAKAAFLAPLILACGGAIASWAVTGDFDATEIRTAAEGAVLSAAAAAAAWLKSTGSAVVDTKVLPAAPAVATTTPAPAPKRKTTGKRAAKTVTPPAPDASTDASTSVSTTAPTEQPPTA